MLHTDRNIDIIIYGATGFTGKLVCQHLQRRYLDPSAEEKLNWAIGGRSQEKLEKVKSELGLPKDLKVFVADSNDEKALNEICKQSKSLVTLVGPYAMYGDKLVAACVANGTHYFDLTGETLWASRQISKLESQARESKTIVVHSCGYDSVPSDLNAMLAVRELKKVAGPDVKVGRVTSGATAKGGVSGGTIASMLNMYDEGVSQLRKAMSCYLLSPVKGHQKKDPSWVTKEPGLVGGFFIMAPHNGAIVRRSWGLLEASSDSAIKNERYGAKFNYDEYLITPGQVAGFLLTLFFRVFALMMLVPQARSLVKKYGTQPGDGPDEITRKNGHFKHITTAHSVEDDVQVRVTMSGNLDPGYGWTAISIAECAVTCVRAHNKLPPLAHQGGFLTPSTALGDALLERLELTGTTKIDKQVLRNDRKKTN